jgi:ELWxxDGT repeat protein
LLLLAAAQLPVAAAAADAYLVHDIDVTGQPYEIPCYLSACPPPYFVHGALPSQLTPLGDRLLLTADDRQHGMEPWVTDGTSAGTRLLADVEPGPEGSDSQFLGSLGEELLFWAEGSGSAGIWATDGTPAGTRFVGSPCADCEPFEAVALPGVYGDQLYFQLYDGSITQLRLFRTDGVVLEPVMSLCARPGFCLQRTRRSLAWQGSLYFDSVFADGPVRLFRLDAAGGAPVEVEAGCGWSQGLVPAGPELWFVGTCYDPGSDRHTAGLIAAADPGAEPRLIRAFGTWAPRQPPPVTRPSRLTPFGDRRAGFLVGDDLWITDGTAGGTQPVGQFELVAGLAGLGHRLLVHGTRDGAQGAWSVDGSGSLHRLTGAEVDGGFHVAGDWAFFAARDPSHGSEPWVTDGTAEGTRMLADIAPGAASSSPGEGGLESTGFVPAGDRVYFAADDGVHDIELWAVDAVLEPSPGTGCTAGAHTLCLHATRFKVEVAWRDFRGRIGTGNVIPLTSDTGAFWFFNPSNYELMVKILDARALDGSFWVFYGALTNVEYTLTVTDTETDRTWERFNPLGQFASDGETGVFAMEP